MEFLTQKNMIYNLKWLRPFAPTNQPYLLDARIHSWKCCSKFLQPNSFLKIFRSIRSEDLIDFLPSIVLVVFTLVFDRRLFVVPWTIQSSYESKHTWKNRKPCLGVQIALLCLVTNGWAQWDFTINQKCLCFVVSINVPVMLFKTINYW